MLLIAAAVAPPPALTAQVCRRFPPVTVLPYVERSAGNAPDHEAMLNLCMAQRDPRVWGADADAFRLRAEEEYERLSVGWAEPAVAPTLDAPNSHMCPAKALSLVVLSEMVCAWLRASLGGPAYEADAPLDPTCWQCSVKDVPVYDGGYGVGAFSLSQS